MQIRQEESRKANRSHSQPLLRCLTRAGGTNQCTERCSKGVKRGVIVGMREPVPNALALRLDSTSRHKGGRRGRRVKAWTPRRLTIFTLVSSDLEPPPSS